MASLLRSAVATAAVTSVAVVGLLVALQDSLLYVKRDYSTFGYQTYYSRQVAAYEAKHGPLTQLSFKTAHMQVSTVAYASELGPGRLVPARIFLILGGNAELGLDALWLFDRALTRGDVFADCVFVSLDYPGYGRSEGEMGEKEATAAANGALEAVRRKLRLNVLPPTTIIAHSLGCAVALRLAAFSTHPFIDSLILSSPFSSLAAEAQQLFVPFLKENPGVRQIVSSLIKEKNQWNNLDFLGSLAERAKKRSRPIQLFLMHSRDDVIVPFPLGEEVHAKAKSLSPFLNTSFSPLEGIDHNSVLAEAWEKHVEPALMSLIAASKL